MVRRIAAMAGERSPIDGPVGADLWNRADRILPGGGIYLTRSADMAGHGVLPGFIAEADGCQVTNADGKRYIDFLGANGPNLLGYRHPEVEAAADTVPTLLVADDPDGTRVRQFSRATAEAGAIFHPFLNWHLSLAHTITDIDTAIEAARIGFDAMAVPGA